MVTVAVASPVSAVAPESSVAEWNRLATTALGNAPSTAMVPGVPPGAGQPPTVAVLHLAMVQTAVYDAVNAIEGGYQPYLSGLDAAVSTASIDAAVATAAHHVLVGLPLPADTVAWLNSAYTYDDAAVTDTNIADGIAAGADAAAKMLHRRSDDGRYPASPAFSFVQGTLPGQWISTTTGASDPFAWVARVDPFMLNSTSQFRTDGPLALTSAEYAAEYIEVKSLGHRDSLTRTESQTAMALFFRANPVEMYNRTFRGIAEDTHLGDLEEARLLAMVNMAGADAIINCWDDKAHWSFWRPLTAIQQAETDNNPATAEDDFWVPLLANPPYPDHPSGYNCVTSAMMNTAADFFGSKKMAFQMTSPTFSQPRTYARFTDVVKDTIDARIYLGIHFRTPDVQGAVIGKKVAHWLDRHYFQPTD